MMLLIPVYPILINTSMRGVRNVVCSHNGLYSCYSFWRHGTNFSDFTWRLLESSVRFSEGNYVVWEAGERPAVKLGFPTNQACRLAGY